MCVCVFEKRARVIWSVPFVMRGAFRAALRVAFEKIVQGVEVQSEVWAVRAWKLLLLLLRMLLFRTTRGGLVSRNQLEARVRRFQAGHWISLDESFLCAEKGRTMSGSILGPFEGVLQPGKLLKEPHWLLEICPHCVH